MTRTIRTLLGGITLAASGAYTFIYLYRWEWNRALMSSALFIAAEVAVVAMLLSRRLAGALTPYGPTLVVGPTTGGVLLSFETARHLGDCQATWHVGQQAEEAKPPVQGL